MLVPISASETHGYDGLDPFAVDLRLGDDEDFDDLVAEECREGTCAWRSQPSGRR